MTHAKKTAGAAAGTSLAADMSGKITQDDLRSILHYEPETGIFTWLKRRNNRAKAGSVAGGLDKNGYITISYLGRKPFAHVLAWIYMTGEHPTRHISVVDHINGIPNDNRFCNLRLVTHKANIENQIRAHKGTRSGLLGVTTRKRPGGVSFEARIRSDGKLHYLGYFETPQAAHEAYLNAKRRMHAGNTL